MSACLGSRTAAVVLAICFTVAQAIAAGPYRVAGSGFDSTVRGKPIVWRDGVVHYWTEQGPLNHAISGEAADAVVAAAFRVWTDVPTAALQAVHAGQLGDDVRGADVVLNGGTLELPADADVSGDERLIVIYDEGGAITDLRFGAGASDATQCVTNAAWSYVDAYAPDGVFAHSVLVLNGNCFDSTERLKYVLLRALGRLLGVGWSQLNDNAYTGKPLPTGIDFAGWPRTHPLDPWCAGYCNYDTKLRRDDIAAISNLYPVTAANVAQWPGKTPFAETTAKLSGRVLFADGRPMQGVNVVARMWDPVAHRASRTIAVSGVSGARYVASRGNVITGDFDANGLRYDLFGSDHAELEGYYELPGLPPGQYQVCVEAVNPLYVGDAAVGASTLATVAPSGTFVPVVVGPLTAGRALTFDITLSASAERQATVPSSWNNPLHVPATGVWLGSIQQHYAADYLNFYAKANHSFTFEITALDEGNHATESKLAPLSRCGMGPTHRGQRRRQRKLRSTLRCLASHGCRVPSPPMMW